MRLFLEFSFFPPLKMKIINMEGMDLFFIN